jgi:CRP-like cAMP-binding protein
VDETDRSGDQERIPSHYFDDVFAALGECKRFEKGRKIFDEDDPASAVYKVIRGASASSS